LYIIMKFNKYNYQTYSNLDFWSEIMNYGLQFAWRFQMSYKELICDTCSKENMNFKKYYKKLNQQITMDFLMIKLDFIFKSPYQYVIFCWIDVLPLKCMPLSCLIWFLFIWTLLNHYTTTKNSLFNQVKQLNTSVSPNRFLKIMLIIT
jgi:hypothetical protein